MRGRNLLGGGLLLAGLGVAALSLAPARSAGSGDIPHRLGSTQKKVKPAKPADHALEGTWTKVAVESNGVKIGCDFTVVFAKDKISWLNMSHLDMSYTLDAARKRVDCVALDGPSKGKPILGIYRLDGDTMTLCLGAPNDKRPTTFDTVRDSGRLLMVFKKKTDAAEAKRESLQGAWEIALTASKDTPPLKIKVAFGEERVSFGALSFLNVTYQIDPSKSPKHIDWTPIEGPKKGQPIPSIYRLEGDTLTICLGEAGGKRPTEFHERKDAGGGLILVFRKWQAAP
jgi:uncharacterized protein (TIGR03067 family)